MGTSVRIRVLAERADYRIFLHFGTLFILSFVKKTGEILGALFVSQVDPGSSRKRKQAPFVKLRQETKKAMKEIKFL